MPKKKKETYEERVEKPKNDTKREVKFKPTEWAVQRGIDPHLFLYWENQLMSEKEFDEINKKVRGE